jgi:hypothetical protein
MQPTIHHLSISAVRADAVFASALQVSQIPDAGQVQRAVAAAVRRFGGRGCAAQVAQEFGEHPELAAARMRWALQIVAEAFGGPGSPHARPGRPGRCPAGQAA